MKYESVLKEDASHIPSRFNLAVCYTKLGNTDAAIAAYRTLLDQNGTIYEARVNLAILLDQSGKRDEAGEQFEKALELRPDDAQAQLNLGMFYIRANNLEKAYPHLTAAVDKGINTPELYVALSELEHTRKNEAKSREYLERAISLDAKNTNLRRQLAGVMSDQKIAKTVRFSRRHDHDRLLLRGGQFHDGSLRKNLFEIRNYPVRRRRSLKRRAHKEMLRF